MLYPEIRKQVKAACPLSERTSRPFLSGDVSVSVSQGRRKSHAQKCSKRRMKGKNPALRLSGSSVQIREAIETARSRVSYLRGQGAASYWWRGPWGHKL